jgi:hypothetical protein
MQQQDLSNSLFQKAVSFINQTNQHVFLTGKAGTGKTTFLRYIKNNSFKKMAVVAPTGVAAIHAGGVTIHSFFNLPFGTYIPTQKTVWGGDFSNVYNKNQLFNKAKLNSLKRDLIRELDLLIIDEISMVRADILDAMDALLRQVRRQPQVPFGGVQMLFIGDMFQLPPVVKEDEWQHLREIYDSPFFFSAQVMREADPVYIELKKIYRQEDPAFIALLNNIRHNECTDEDLQLLNSYYDPSFEPFPESGYITLTSHNYKADAINQQELDKIIRPVYALEAQIQKDFPEHNYPVEKLLYLKEGAQIMFIKNDKGEMRRYYNGKIGTIERIEEAGTSVFVRFPNEPEAFQMERETWKNIRYKYDSHKDTVEEEELGTFTQYPIRLAWAVTIHKSQGLTFDKAIVDAGRSFAPGQVYVALSRLTGLQGLVLKSRIEYRSISTDPQVIAFARKELPEHSLQQTLALSQKIFAEQSLLDSYQWNELEEQVHLHAETYTRNSIPNLGDALIWVQELMSKTEKQKKVAQKFRHQLFQLLQQGTPAYRQLTERTHAAADWFLTEITQILRAISGQMAEYKVKQRTKKYMAELEELQLCWERKKMQIQQSVCITDALARGDEWTLVLEEVEKLHRPLPIAAMPPTNDLPEKQQPAATAKQPKGTTKQITLQMFGAGKSIAEIAAERSLTEGTIYGHLIEFIGTEFLSIHTLLPLEKLSRVLEAIKQNPEAKSSELKEILGEDFSYNEIRAGMTYWSKDGQYA